MVGHGLGITALTFAAAYFLFELLKPGFDTPLKIHL